MGYRGVGLSFGPLVGALLLWFLNALFGWGNLAGAVIVGAFAGAGTAAGLRLWRSYGKGAVLDSGPEHKPVMKLREERLEVDKHLVQTAEVQVHREWVKEKRKLEIPLYREELVIEKDGEELRRIPLRAERLKWHKVPVKLNEVRIRRDRVEESEPVDVLLRKEIARINTAGEVDVSETGTRTEG